jgi:hypothetical protein
MSAGGPSSRLVRYFETAQLAIFERGWWQSLMRIFRTWFSTARPEIHDTLDRLVLSTQQTWRVVVRVVIRRQNVPDLTAEGPTRRTFERKTIVSAASGREFSEFGTVRPRVQIPGPRPTF